MDKSNNNSGHREAYWITSPDSALQITKINNPESLLNHTINKNIQSNKKKKILYQNSKFLILNTQKKQKALLLFKSNY